MLNDFIMKTKKSVAELGHSLKINVRRPWRLSPFLKNGLEYWAEILNEV